MDNDKLLEALENESNSSIINLTSSKIAEHKNNILQDLHLPREVLKMYHKKLKHYRYCSEISDLVPGNFIRWIVLKDIENIYLTNGAFFCDTDFMNNALQVICRNGRGAVFQVKFDEVLIFQRLSDEEKLILKVMDYLDK